MSLPTVQAAALPVCLLPASKAARGYIEAARSASTRKAYATDWQTFSVWCADKGQTLLPASLIEPCICVLEVVCAQ